MIADQLARELVPGTETRNLFKIDLLKPAQKAVLERELTRELSRAVEILHRLDPGRSDPLLETFRERFEVRYGDRRDVPLVEVLDEDVGIGFGTETAPNAERSKLIADLELPEVPERPLRRWGYWQTHLLRRLNRAIAAAEKEMVISPDEIEQAGGEAEYPPREMPDAFHVMAEVSSPSAEALASGDYLILARHVLGPSGARFLGRFANLSKGLREGLEEHLREEEACRPDAIFAEIVHLPNGSVGNISNRPPLRKFEIPFLGRGSAPDYNQIPISDLRVSVIGKRIELTSQRFGREVIPRLSTAHSFVPGNLDIYRFLCTLQTQGVADWMAWDWGPLGSAPFLPRIRCGRLILARAQWILDSEEITRLTSRAGVDLLIEAREWRAQRGVPRRAVLAEGDRELLVDFENILSLESFADILSGNSELKLAEMFPDGDGLWTEGPEGRFFHQLIVPFIRQDRLESSNSRNEAWPNGTPSTAPAHRVYANGTGKFAPGSDWLYAKIYTAPGIADEVIRDVLRPVAAGALGTRSCDRWFFLRYGDPEWHLRFRIHGRAEVLRSRVLPLLEQHLRPRIAEGSVWRFCLDTYDPELNRYGGSAAMPAVERLFYGDSEAVAEIISILAEGEDAEARCNAAVVGLDRLFSDLGLDLSTRVEVTHHLRTELSREFHADIILKRQLGQRHREHRETLAALLDGRALEDGRHAWMLPAFQRRSCLAEAAVKRLQSLSRDGRLAVPIRDLAIHLAHMHINRLMVGSARIHELVLYEFFYREYRACAERQQARPTARRTSSPSGF